MKTNDEPDQPLPPLPASANYYLRKEKLEVYTWALSDILCWLNGFVAGGGTYEPGRIEDLRDLSCALKSIQAMEPKGDSDSHSKP